MTQFQNTFTYFGYWDLGICLILGFLHLTLTKTDLPGEMIFSG